MELPAFSTESRKAKKFIIQKIQTSSQSTSKLFAAQKIILQVKLNANPENQSVKRKKTSNRKKIDAASETRRSKTKKF